MASETLSKRPKKDYAAAAAAAAGPAPSVGKRAKKYAMARRGLRSLGLAVAVPLLITAAGIYSLGSGGQVYGGLAKPFWYPPLWAFHLASLSTSCLMGLSAWLVWADGGFHESSGTLPLYLAQLLLGLAWAPAVFRYGATGAGFAVCIALLAALYGCYTSFRRVNPIAADLVKPCLAWAGFLGLMNFKLL